MDGHTGAVAVPKTTILTLPQAQLTHLERSKGKHPLMSPSYSWDVGAVWRKQLCWVGWQPLGLLSQQELCQDLLELFVFNGSEGKKIKACPAKNFISLLFIILIGNSERIQ